MKHFKRMLAITLSLSILLACLPVMSVFAKTIGGTCGQNATWSFDDDTGVLTISGSGDITDYDMYYFCFPWFDLRETIRSVRIETGITNISSYAFADCTNLTSITIPNSVTTISQLAFADCSSLTSVTIPDSVTAIGRGTFYGCISLTEISVESENTAYTSQDGVLFSKDKTQLLTYPARKNGSYVIPDGVTSIGEYAFYGCSDLTSVTIPKSVTSIGVHAFYSCSSLTSVTIPSGVTNIDNSAFNKCSGLTEISVESENTAYTSQDGILFSKDKTQLLTCPKAKKGKYVIPDGVISIGEYAFSDCSHLTSVTIPDGVISIGEHAFSDCSNLAFVTVPASVTSIGRWAFIECNSLTIKCYQDSAAFHYAASNNIPFMFIVDDSRAGDNATWSFDDDTGVLIISGSGDMYHYNRWDDVDAPWYVLRDWIQSVVIEDGITNVGDFAFYDCTRLTSVTVPDSVTSIGTNAFNGCSSLAAITLPDNITSIGINAFYDTEYYTRTGTAKNGAIYIGDYLIRLGMWHRGDYTVADDTKIIADGAFYDCWYLTSVTIPDSVTSIGNYAFYDCCRLASITIPDSVTSIGASAFSFSAYYEDATNWKDGALWIGNHFISADQSLSGAYTVPAGAKTIAGKAFAWCKNLTSVTIPDGITSIDEQVFYDCDNLTSVTLPDSVTNISEEAFITCPRLTSITIPESVTQIGDRAFGYRYVWETWEDDNGNFGTEKYIKALPDCSIIGYIGTAAEAYAKENGFRFLPILALTDSLSNVTVTGTISPEMQLKVRDSATSDTRVTYDISLVQNGEEVQPDRAVTVKIPLPAGMSSTECRVYRAEACDYYTDMKAVYQNGFMVFTAKHFSEYIITTDDLSAQLVTIGDVDHDREIALGDVVVLAQYVAEWDVECNVAALDVNGD